MTTWCCSSLGWAQIIEHCWSNMTSQLIIQCCRGWPNCATCGVQQYVIMCTEQRWRVCQTNQHLLSNKSNVYCHFFFSFSFGRIAQLVAHSLHEWDVPGSSPVYGFFSSAATRVARFGERHHAHTFVGLKCLTETKRQILYDHVSTLLRWDVQLRQPTLLDQQYSSVWPQPYISNLSLCPRKDTSRKESSV